MCLGAPGRVIRLDAVAGDPAACRAVVEIGGQQRLIDLVLLADDLPSPGDWVLVHLGFAMSRMTATEASEALDGLTAMAADHDPTDEAAIFAAWGLAAPDTPR